MFAVSEVEPPFESVRAAPTSIGSIRIYERGGDRPLLLWPSLFTDHRLYSRVSSTLGRHWRILAIDGPGFGASARPRKNVQPFRYARVIVEILDHLGIERAAFAGTSWGGQIGAYLAAYHADRVNRVLMINTPLAPSIGGHLFEVGMARLAVKSRLYANGVARAMFSPSTLQNKPNVVRDFKAIFPTFDPRDAAVTASTTLRQFQGLAEILPRIVAPTAMLFGEDDPLYASGDVLPLARTAPDAEITILPGCGHLIPAEAPEEMAIALKRLDGR